MKIIFPIEIGISALSGSNIGGCKIIKNSNSRSLSNYSKISSFPITLLILDSFDDGDYTTSTNVFQLELNGLLNARSLAPSSTFQIYFYD